MTNPIIKLVNSQTGEEVERPMTAEEFAEYKEFQQVLKDEEAAKSALQARKQEVLAKLGLTQDEVTALLA